MMARSVIGGSLASVGVIALLSPILLYVAAVASLLAFFLRIIDTTFSLTEAGVVLAPWLVGALIAALVGGYVAAALARGQRARHGGTAAMLGLALSLVFAMTLVSASLIGGLVAIAALIALPIAVIGGRAGALLAPRTIPLSTLRTISEGARPEPLRPAAAVGRKGGEREDRGPR